LVGVFKVTDENSKIRIRIQSGQWIRRAKMTHTIIEQNKEISCFEVLDVPLCGLKASPVAWMFFMEA
jgi:hypothetical protein